MSRKLDKAGKNLTKGKKDIILKPLMDGGIHVGIITPWIRMS